MNYKSFETERLYLIPTQLEDEAFIYQLMNSPKWIKYIGDRKIRSVQDANSYIQEKMIPHLEKKGFGNYTVLTKKDKQKIGTCGLYDREGLENVDIGFAFLPEFQNLGYAYEAANKLLHEAKSSFGLHTISAITLKTNHSSQKLLEKLGLTYTKMIEIPNDDEELMLYQIQL